MALGNTPEWFFLHLSFRLSLQGMLSAGSDRKTQRQQLGLEVTSPGIVRLLGLRRASPCTPSARHAQRVGFHPDACHLCLQSSPCTSRKGMLTPSRKGEEQNSTLVCVLLLENKVFPATLKLGLISQNGGTRQAFAAKNLGRRGLLADLLWLQNQGSVKGRGEGVRLATHRFGVPLGHASDFGLYWRTEDFWAGWAPAAAVPGSREVVRGYSSRDVRPFDRWYSR